MTWPASDTNMFRAMLLLAVIGGGAMLSAHAATIDRQAALAFEVASVRPSAPDGQGIHIDGFHPTQFTARHATLATLLVFAYDLRSIEQVTGGPAWIRSQEFDIVATSAAAHAPSEVALKVRELLIDRFALRARLEKQEGAIYVMKAVRGDNMLGPNLLRSTVDCAALIAAGQTLPQSVADGRTPCTARQSLSGRTRMLQATAMPLVQLASMLAVAAGRDVVDQTGLAGAFDAELTWAPDIQPAPGGRDTTLPAADDVSIFTAVQEQLGLKLEPARGPVKTLVIDAVQRPTAD